MLRRLFTRIFSLETLFSDQFTALLSPSAEYSQGISKPFPAPLFTLLPVILQLILLLGRLRNIFIHKLKHLGHMSNHSSIFYHGYGILIFHISWLVPALKAFSYHWCPYFLVHIKTTNIRFKSVFFCRFSPMLFFSSFRINICTVSVQSQKHHRKSLTY